jgi:hypothetical protein
LPPAAGRSRSMVSRYIRASSPRALAGTPRKRLEPGGISLRPVGAVERVSLGFQDRLLRLATGPGNDLVVLGPRLVDHSVPLLLGLVHLVPRGLDRVGGFTSCRTTWSTVTPISYWLHERLKAFLTRTSMA